MIAMLVVAFLPSLVALGMHNVLAIVIAVRFATLPISVQDRHVWISTKTARQASIIALRSSEVMLAVRARDSIPLSARMLLNVPMRPLARAAPVHVNCFRWELLVQLSAVWTIFSVMVIVLHVPHSILRMTFVLISSLAVLTLSVPHNLDAPNVNSGSTKRSVHKIHPVPSIRRTVPASNVKHVFHTRTQQTVSLHVPFLDVAELALLVSHSIEPCAELQMDVVGVEMASLIPVSESSVMTETRSTVTGARLPVRTRLAMTLSKTMMRPTSIAEERPAELPINFVSSAKAAWCRLTAPLPAAFRGAPAGNGESLHRW
mmetsp:Transcript_4061/g.10002  ORF Transcript_4061/g.10002 Transcript_4061/m.10002 type:complete len:317 (-) Transcript_4061:3047-3997(-)